MYPTSTQRKYWMKTPKELEELRSKSGSGLLTPNEESHLVRSYLVTLKEFCRKFQPPMRKSVIATAFIYMKRFYLHESCASYHPKNIGITCAYLACKVDEFNVSIDQFLKNVNGDCRKAQKTVLSNELLLMKKLNFHLTVHLPFRAVEGFQIDIRAKFTDSNTWDRLEAMTAEIDDYLDKSMFTDACFLYTPSQIALASVCHAAEKVGWSKLEDWLETLFGAESEALDNFRLAASDITRLIEEDLQNSPGKDVVKKIEKKLSK